MFHSVRLLTVALLLATAFPAAASQAAGQSGRMMAPMPAHSDAAATLKQDMRKLWTDHVVWTRDYIIAAVGDQPDAQAAANRLMKNQEDIGKAVAAFYGEAAGQQIAEGIVKQFPEKFGAKPTTTSGVR